MQNSLNITFRKTPTTKRLPVQQDANEWLMKLCLPRVLADSSEGLPPPRVMTALLRLLTLFISGSSLGLTCLF